MQSEKKYWVRTSEHTDEKTFFEHFFYYLEFWLERNGIISISTICFWYFFDEPDQEVRYDVINKC